MSTLNDLRAQRGRNLVDAYIAENGGDGTNVLRDMLTDLMHRSDQDCEAECFDDALWLALRVFTDEQEGV